MVDLLSDIVRHLELRSSLYFRARLSAPYALDVPADRRVIRFHLVTRGRSWIGVESGESRWCEAGDLILVPHGVAHRLAHAPTPFPAFGAHGPESLTDASCDRRSPASGGETPDRALDLSRALELDPIVDGVFRHGGRGECADLVCGYFEFDESIVHPLIGRLPPLLHLRGGDGTGFGWMAPLLEEIEREKAWTDSIGDRVVECLSEVLFIQILRSLRAHSVEDRSTFAAVVDPQLARALEAIHAHPAHPHTLERLAALAGLSRTVFVERFRQALGMTPMRYVGHWRIQRARALLLDARLSVGEIGRRVGYDSEAAFSRAFRELCGQPPSRFRRTRMESAA